RRGSRFRPSPVRAGSSTSASTARSNRPSTAPGSSAILKRRGECRILHEGHRRIQVQLPSLFVGGGSRPWPFLSATPLDAFDDTKEGRPALPGRGLPTPDLLRPGFRPGVDPGGG